MSFCGSAVHGIGVEGTLDLYTNKKVHIASIYWKGPYSRQRNQFEVTEFNAQHYIVMAGPIPSKGILGDVLVTVIAVGEDYASNI